MGQSPFFRVHSMAQVLPGGQGKLLHEARDGKFWIGTNQGLLDYDGLEFHFWPRPDNGNPEVTAIYEDLFRKLWVGYADGAIFTYKSSSLIAWAPEEGNPRVPIKGFVEDFDRNMWIATYGEGLYIHDGKHLYNINDQDDGLSADEIYTMTRDHQGRIWVGTDQGISICSFKEQVKKVETLSVKDGLPDQIVRTILADAAGNMWIGTYDQGFIRYQVTANKFDSSPFAAWDLGVINNLELLEGKELWIGTENQGLWRYSLQQHRLEKQSPLNPGLVKKITDLQKDREGNLWVLDNSENIFLSQRQFDFLSGPASNTQALLITNDGDIYLGISSGLYVRSDVDSTWHLVPGTTGINILTLFEDNFKTLWVGTFGQGILWLDLTSKRTRWWTEKEGLANNAVLSISGSGGQVWAATLGGVTSILLPSPVWIEQPALQHQMGLTKWNNYTYHVRIDPIGRAWFGTDGHGPMYWENGQMNSINQLTGPLDSTTLRDLKTTFSVSIGSDTSIWFNGGQSIYNYKNSQLKKVYQSSGQLLITSIETTINNQLLVIEQGQVLIIDAKDGTYTRYGEGVGIKKFEGNLNCLTKDLFGNIVIGGASQIIHYSPVRENINRKPRITLNTVKVQGINYNFVGPLRLKHFQNQITFNYSGLWFNNPPDVLYKYRLVNYDDSWRISRDKEASYANLSPGNYIFEVSSAIDNQWTTPDTTSLQINISKPIWQKLWFILAALIVLSSGILYIIKIRDQELRRISMLETERAKSQLAALQAQINPHFLFNSFNTLSTIIEEDPKGAVQYVEKMSDFFRSMLSVRDTELISLDEETKLVQDYVYLLEKRFGKAIHLLVDLPKEFRHLQLIPLTLQLLVENAVKHNIVSKSKPLTVHIFIDEEKRLVVKNNRQPKHEKTVSTGFGLSSLTKRYQLLNKTLIIEDPVESFTVKIPLVK